MHPAATQVPVTIRHFYSAPIILIVFSIALVSIFSMKFLSIAAGIQAKFPLFDAFYLICIYFFGSKDQIPDYEFFIPKIVSYQTITNAMKTYRFNR